MDGMPVTALKSTLDAPAFGDMSGPFEALRAPATHVPSLTSRDQIVVETVSSITAIARDWLALEGRTRRPTAFQSFAWCKAWVEAAARSGSPEQLRIVVVRRAAVVKLIWPLAVKRMAFCNILGALGEPATQYCDVLIDPLEDPATLLAEAWRLIRSWPDIDLLDLRRVPDDSGLYSLPPLLRSASHSGPSSKSPRIDGRVALAAAVNRSSRTRNALLRHQKKLAERGPVQFEVVEDPIQKRETLFAAMRFKHEWIRSRGIWSNGYSHPAAEALTRQLAHCDEYCVTRLVVGGQTAAVEAGLLTRSHYWSLTQSYDLALEKHGPGRLLTWRFLEHCLATGVEHIDFLAPAQPHKTEWSNTNILVRDHVLALTLKGSILANGAIRSRPLLRELCARLPPAVRNILIQAGQSKSPSK